MKAGGRRKRRLKGVIFFWGKKGHYRITLLLLECAPVGGIATKYSGTSIYGAVQSTDVVSLVSSPVQLRIGHQG